MEFFKQNEEVIDLVLTPKGRELLAKGMFTPASYSFHDIDVKYENNNGEPQNEIASRIKTSARLKAPSYYSSGEDYYRDGKTGQVIRKHNLANRIGDKILGNQYAPAWKIKFINSPDFQNYVSGSALITPKYYTTYITANTFENIIENEGLEEVIPQLNITSYYQKVEVKNFVDKDGKKYIKTFIVEDNELLAEIEEINAFEENETDNYYIEVYLEASDGKDKGKLVQLLFNKEINNEYSIENYLNITFDNNADFEQKIKTVDIYGPGGKDTPSNC